MDSARCVIGLWVKFCGIVQLTVEMHGHKLVYSAKRESGSDLSSVSPQNYVANECPFCNDLKPATLSSCFHSNLQL